MRLVALVVAAVCGCGSQAASGDGGAAAGPEGGEPDASEPAQADAGGSDGGGPTADAADSASVADASKPPPLPDVRFVDVTEAAGLAMPEPDFEPTPECHSEHMLRGAAAGDFDGDGDLDLFLARVWDTDLMFRNRGDGSFAEIGAEAGVDHAGPTNAALAFDVEGDGDLDLYVTSAAPELPRLYVNDGTGHFTDEASPRGVAIAPEGCQSAWSASAADVDGDGDLDLHTTAWQARWRGDEPNDRGRLLLNDGRGHFTDGTIAAGLDIAGRSSFTSAFGDVDDDGHPDLALCADFGNGGLFLNAGDGTFREVTEEAGVGIEESGMGCDLGDMDGDGDLDWFVTSIFDPTEPCPPVWGCIGNRLYDNRGDGTFTDVTEEAGVWDGGWGWGTAFVDYDNDGDLDIAVANGYPVYPFRDDPLKLYRNDGSGEFEEVAAEHGLVELGQGRGLLPFDYDVDGDADLLVVNRGGLARLYRNDGGEARGWLCVRLSDPGSANPFGVGAVVRVTARPGGPTLRRDVHANSNYTTGRPPVASFGLGAGPERVHDVRVTWPDGTEQVERSVRTRRLLRIERRR